MARRGTRPTDPTSARRRARTGIIFASPALLLIAVFFAFPALAALALSVTDFDIYAIGEKWFGIGSTVRFIGLENYRRLLADPLFWTALRNTFFFVLVGGPLTLATALGMALLLNARSVRLKGLFRTIYFAPVVTTLVAVATVWRYLYHPRFGLLNYLLSLVGLGPIDWLGDPHWALPSLVILAVWKNFGYSMVLFIAGLQNIPESLYEAARIDGAGWWRQFRAITLPLLAPTFLFVGIITTIGYFQFFAEPYVMTNQGGPVNRTLSIALLMYKQGFRWWNMGYAAAIALVLFLIVLAASAIQLRLQGGREK
jgi:multiple sugar transport system permease protein